MNPHERLVTSSLLELFDDARTCIEGSQEGTRILHVHGREQEVPVAASALLKLGCVADATDWADGRASHVRAFDGRVPADKISHRQVSCLDELDHSGQSVVRDAGTLEANERAPNTSVRVMLAFLSSPTHRHTRIDQAKE
jgi:hypothetical protein